MTTCTTWPLISNFLRRRWMLAGALLMGLVSVASAQVATGDSRGTVPEPTFPAVCQQVPADLTIVSGEPSSELNTATDTSTLQTALSNASCAGKAVEVVMGSGGQNAMVIAPIAIPKTVTLLVDGGITLFGSRNASDYQISGSTSTCGSTDGGTGCNPLITLGQSTVNGTSQYMGTVVSGLMGYGVINGRGYDKLITISGSTVTTLANSWWDNAVGGAEDSPVMVYSYRTESAVLYKITLLNGPHFHVKIQGQGQATSAGTKYQTNFTVWGLKLLTPYTPHNTDGIDPTGVWNMTVANSVIGDGDDESAISGSSTTQNFTYSNLLLASGHGLSIGSITTSPINNVLYNNVNFSGQAADGNEIALRIKSYCGDGGGLVSLVTYQNACIQNVKAALEVDPYYSATSSTTSCPVFGSSAAPITFQNIYVLTPASDINLQGYNNAANYANIALNNVYVNGPSLALSRIQSSDASETPGTPAYANISLNGSYYPSGWNALASTANNVTETVSGSAAASFPATACANAFPTLLGEVFASTTTGGVTTNNINAAATVTIPATVTLNAMVIPTNSEATYSTYTGVPAPTASVQFYDGATLVGTAPLAANGTLASVTVTNPTAGLHTYTAQYVGDSTYPATVLGANTTGTETQQVQITVNAGPGSQVAFTTPPSASLISGSAVAPVTVTVEDAAGDVTTNSTASVTLTVTGPSGYTATYGPVTATSGVATFNSIASPPSYGSYTYTATSTGLTSASAVQTVQSQLQVTATSTSRIFGLPNPSFGYTITGFANGDTSSVVSGAPVLSTTAVPNSPAGQYPIAVAQGSLTATNYVFVENAGTLTVTGGAPQLVNFYPLPNFANGGTYQLSATASSGLPVTYSVSGIGASISGNTLRLFGALGQKITVTASQAGNASYAAAANVVQSFVAQ